MIAYENDTLNIPEKYKNMSASELEHEKQEMLSRLLAGNRKKKSNVESPTNIVFNFK